MGRVLFHDSGHEPCVNKKLFVITSLNYGVPQRLIELRGYFKGRQWCGTELDSPSAQGKTFTKVGFYFSGRRHKLIR